MKVERLRSLSPSPLSLPEESSLSEYSLSASEDVQMFFGNSFHPIPERVFPEGQIEWTTAGQYVWTVPDGVFEISAIAIGAGGQGGSATSHVNRGAGGGGAGGTVYASLKVEPHQELTIEIGSIGSNESSRRTRIHINSKATLVANGGNTGGNGGRYGGGRGSGGTATGTSGATSFTGGSGGSGFYSRDFSPSSQGGNGGIPADIPSLGAGVLVPGGPVYGVGQGGESGGTSNGDGSPRTATGGAVRIIWGRNRYYPDSNVNNV